MLRPHADLVWDLGAGRARRLALARALLGRPHRQHAVRPGPQRQQRLPLRARRAPRQPTRRRRPRRARLRPHPVHRRRLPHAGGQDAHRRRAAAAHDRHGRRARRAGGRAATRSGASRRTARRRGGVGGYAEYLGTAGARGEPIRDRLTVGGARRRSAWPAAAASRPAAACSSRPACTASSGLGSDLGLSLEGGVARAPNGNFSAAARLGRPRLGARRAGQRRRAGAAGAHRLQRRRRALSTRRASDGSDARRDARSRSRSTATSRRTSTSPARR